MINICLRSHPAGAHRKGQDMTEIPIDALTAHDTTEPAHYAAHYVHGAGGAPTYTAANRWDEIEPEPHSGYVHGAPMPEPEITARVDALAGELLARAMADGATVATVGSVADIALSIHGRIATERERLARRAHTGWHGGRTTGETAPVSPAPDGYTRVRAQVRTERTNKGATVARVTVHGRAYVGGSFMAQPSPALAMSPERLAYAIETAPATALGHRDAVSLARLTGAAYPDIPDLIGGDVIAWTEYGSGDAMRAYDASGRPRAPRTAWPTRYRLPTVRIRKGEQSQARTGELLAPCDDAGATVWLGHRRIARAETVRDARAQRARRIDDAVNIPKGARLPETLAMLGATAPAPYRLTWAHRGLSGAVTVATVKGAPSISVSGLPRKVNGYRTRRGLERAIARAIA